MIVFWIVQIGVFIGDTTISFLVAVLDGYTLMYHICIDVTIGRVLIVGHIHRVDVATVVEHQSPSHAVSLINCQEIVSMCMLLSNT